MGRGGRKGKGETFKTRGGILAVETWGKRERKRERREKLEEEAN